MSDIVEAISVELHGVRLVSVAVFKDNQLVDIITKEPENDDAGFSEIVDAIFTHDINSVELRTDSEELFRQTVTTPGILGRIVSSEELSILHRQLRPGSPEYEAICVLYELDDGSKAKTEPKKVGLIARIIKRVKQLLKTFN